MGGGREHPEGWTPNTRWFMVRKQIPKEPGAADEPERRRLACPVRRPAGRNEHRGNRGQADRRSLSGFQHNLREDIARVTATVGDALQ